MQVCLWNIAWNKVWPTLHSNIAEQLLHPSVSSHYYYTLFCYFLSDAAVACLQQVLNSNQATHGELVKQSQTNYTGSPFIT